MNGTTITILFTVERGKGREKRNEKTGKFYFVRNMIIVKNVPSSLSLLYISSLSPLSPFPLLRFLEYSI